MLDSKYVRRTVAALVVCAACAQAGAATNASVAGTVIGPGGIDVPGVQLRLVEADTGREVRAVSGEGGVFRITNLAAGRYRLEADLEGFAPAVVAVDLSAGEARAVTIRLQMAAHRERVQVVGRSPRDTLEIAAIREGGARDAGEAVATLPGASMLRKGAIANDLVLRGFQSRDLTVVIDGERIYGACPSHMDPPAFHVDFAEVSRIEVGKGPFDIKNQGGIGGTVNVVTERPRAGRHGTLNLAMDSAVSIAPSASGSLGWRRVSALAGLSARRAAPYQDGDGRPFTAGANYRPEHREDTAYSAVTGWGRIAAVPAPGATLQVSATRQEAGRILYPYLQMDALSDAATRAAARLEVADLPGRWTELAAHVYFTRVSHWMTDQLRASSIGVQLAYSMGTRAATRTIGGKAEVRRAGLTLGAEAFERAHDAQTMMAGQGYRPQASIPDVATVTAGGFAEYAATAGPVEISAGARLDRARSAARSALVNTGLYAAYHGTTATRGVDALPAAQVRVVARPADGWRIAGGIGHARRSPEPQERYLALQRMGTDWVGNPMLRPTANTGLDADVTWTGRGLVARASAYAYRLDDFIVVADQPRVRMVAGVMNRAARTYANVDALVRGVEGAVSWPVAPAWFVSADVSRVRGTRRAAPAGARDLPEIPAARARARLRFDNGRAMASLDVSQASRQRHVLAALGETATPGWTIVSTRASIRHGRLTLTGGVDNLFDRTYRDHLSYLRDPYRSGAVVYEPGRTASANVSLVF